MEINTIKVPYRRSVRRQWIDYDGDTIFMVTVVCHERRHLLGEIVNGRMVMSLHGLELDRQLRMCDSRYKGEAEVHNFAVMPNHFHAIIQVNGKRNRNREEKTGCLSSGHNKPLEDMHHNTMLARVVGAIKAAVSREAKKAGLAFAWQRNFYESELRDQGYYDNAMNYIDENVERWANGNPRPFGPRPSDHDI